MEAAQSSGRVEKWLPWAVLRRQETGERRMEFRLFRGCAVARLRGCAVARLRGCAVARLRGCAVARTNYQWHSVLHLPVAKITELR